VVATHDLDMVLDLCSRTIVMKDGQVATDGSTADILYNEELLQSCCLEKPLRLQGCPICSATAEADGDGGD
jgi:cobalt/nickel transport system ATP-binding protein